MLLAYVLLYDFEMVILGPLQTVVGRQRREFREVNPPEGEVQCSSVHSFDECSGVHDAVQCMKYECSEVHDVPGSSDTPHQA